MIKAIAITSAFFITYSIELIIRVYEFVAKSDVHPIVDIIAAVFVGCNTLLNSIILLKFDGLVQRSALEMLGLEDWWGQNDIKMTNHATNQVNLATPKQNITKNQAAQDNDRISITRNMNSVVTRKV